MRVLALSLLLLAGVTKAQDASVGIGLPPEEPVPNLLDPNTCPCADDANAVQQQIKDDSILISLCDPNDEEFCQTNCRDLHGPNTRYLNDKCCIHAGKSASLLAFEEDSKWVDRLAEFNKCTGASVRLDYLPEGEDGMADALKMDVGEDTEQDGDNTGGQGIFDAYIVQSPW